MRPFVFSLIVAASIVAAAAPAAAAPAPGTLQLGPVPVAGDGPPWALAVPLDAPPGRCALETADERLRLETGPDGLARLVVEGTRPGPVSGLLGLEDAAGVVRHLAVAAEGVVLSDAAVPGLLLTAARGGEAVRRLVRAPRPLAALELDGVRTAVPAPDAAGWQELAVAAPCGTTERRGRLVLADGSILDLQVSLLESITTLAATVLPEGWTYGPVLPLRERLDRTALRARVAVVARRAGARRLRTFRVGPDPETNGMRFARRAAVRLPEPDPELARRYLRLRVGDAAQPQPRRRPLLLRLAGERVRLIDPAKGPVAARRLAGLRFAGAAVRSDRHRDRLYAVRRDPQSGARYLRRWRAGLDAGGFSLRGRLFEAPLQERLGLGDLRAYDLRTWRRDARYPERPVRESLLLLAGGGAGGQADLPLSLWELRPRRDGSGRYARVRRRYASELAQPADGPAPRLRWQRTPTVGAAGYPRLARIGVPAVQAGELVSLDGLGARFTGRAYVEGASHAMAADGYSLDPIYLMRADHDGQDTRVRRLVLREGRPAVRARGVVRGRRVLDLRTSVRGRHSYLLTDDGGGGPGARHALRLLANGLAPGTNLPPRVDAGPDLAAVATERRYARVRLRARLRDAQGDPLAVRWSAPGARFADPSARVTEALLPIGANQVRVRAREAAKAGPYAASDVLTVTVRAPTGTGDAPALATALRGIYPNPANPRTRIAFTLAERGRVRIRVHDLAGRLVRELLDAERGAGAWDVPWDGTDDGGRAVASGVYTIRLEAGGRVDTGRAVIVR